MVAQPAHHSDESMEKLMERYVDGSADAFDELYRTLSPNILSYLESLTYERARAEQLLQTTFYKVHRARSSYLAGTAVRPWIIAIARRAFLDGKGAVKRSRDASRARQVSAGAGHLLGHLSGPSREAIELTRFAGLSTFEAAVVLGTSEAALTGHLDNGYQQLRQLLEAGAKRS